MLAAQEDGERAQDIPLLIEDAWTGGQQHTAKLVRFLQRLETLILAGLQVQQGLVKELAWFVDPTRAACLANTAPMVSAVRRGGLEVPVTACWRRLEPEAGIPGIAALQGGRHGSYARIREAA